MKVLVTGASGMVGRAVVERLASDGAHDVVAAVRRSGSSFPAGVQIHVVGDLGEQPDWPTALAHVDVVVHTAARVHQMQDAEVDPLPAFRRINSEATARFATQAAAAGVRRFILISSIKVNGEATLPGVPFSADDAPAPQDAYALSKLEAEQGLREIAAQTRMEYVIVRPPLVYGPGVKANFLSMMRWLRRGVPLPLGDIKNRRSLIALDNLVDLLVTCIAHPAAVNRIFLVCDDETLSTTELLRRMGRALGRPVLLLPIPVFLLKLAAGLVGRPGIAHRLCGSLEVDIVKTRQLLGWHPPVGVDEGLRRAATEFLMRKDRQ